MFARKNLLIILIIILISASILMIYLINISNVYNPSSRAVTTEKELIKIKIGLIPVVDSFPIFIAEKEDLFKKHGLDAEIVLFGSAKDRDNAIISGAVDVAIHDPVGTLILYSRNVSVKIIGFLCCDIMNESNIGFYLLASPTQETGNITSVAVSRNTIIEYVAWKMLENMNIDPSKINFIDVPSITNRYQLLIEGKISFAVLPDPWGTLAINKGAKLISRYKDLVVIIAREEYIKKPYGRDALKRLVDVINEAIDLYTKDPDKYIDYINEKLSIPKELIGVFKISWGRHVSKPSEQLIEEINSWLLERGIISRKIDYKDVVEDLWR